MKTIAPGNARCEPKHISGVGATELQSRPCKKHIPGIRALESLDPSQPQVHFSSRRHTAPLGPASSACVWSRGRLRGLSAAAQCVSPSPLSSACLRSGSSSSVSAAAPSGPAETEGLVNGRVRFARVTGPGAKSRNFTPEMETR